MHRVGQTPFGHLLGLTGQRPQRLGDRPRHQPRHDTGDGDGGHREHEEPPLAGLGGRRQLVRPLAHLALHLLAEHAVGERLRVVAGGEGDHAGDVDLAGRDRLVDHLGEPDDDLGTEEVLHQRDELAGGARRHVLVVRPQLPDVAGEDVDLGRRVHPVGRRSPDLRQQLVADELGDEVGLLAVHVDQLDALAELRVVDLECDLAVGRGQAVHDRRVPGEVL